MRAAGWQGLTIGVDAEDPDQGFIPSAFSWDEARDLLQAQGTPQQLDLLVLRTVNDIGVSEMLEAAADAVLKLLGSRCWKQESRLGLLCAALRAGSPLCPMLV